MSEYGNPLNNVIEFLESEKSRRIKALESNSFCDNKTIQKNIDKLNKCLDIIEEPTNKSQVSYLGNFSSLTYCNKCGCPVEIYPLQETVKCIVCGENINLTIENPFGTGSEIKNLIKGGLTI